MNDYIDTEGLVDETKFEPKKGNGKAKALRFQIKPFEAIKLSTEPNYRVVGIFPRVGLVVVWGPPKCGKSFWVFDLVMHVALGWKYRGRKVQQGTVVYLALEGGPGFAARKEAWRQRHIPEYDQTLVPFKLIDVPVDLVADHKALIEDIEAQVMGNPDVVVIDTLNRSLNGSESKDEDMARYIRAADTIRARFGCLVIIIHHCGVEGSRPRGHTSLTGADDAQIAVYRDKDGNITVTIEHMKDGEASPPMGSKLEPVRVGTNDEGDPITSCIIVETDVVDKKAHALPDSAKLARDQLQELIADIGEIPPASNHIPPNTKVCSKELWREHFYNTYAGKPETKQKAFVRAATTLQKARLIGIWNDKVWLAGHAGHTRTFKEASGERIDPDMAADGPVAEKSGRTDRTPPLKGCPVSGSHVRDRLSVQTSVQPKSDDNDGPVVEPIMSWEMDELKTRGFTPDDMFGMSPERARAIIADPESNKLSEIYGKGEDAPPGTLCRFCKQPGKVRFFSAPEDPLTPSHKRVTLSYPLHLEHVPHFFDSGMDLQGED